MSCLVGDSEDTFSHGVAHIDFCKMRNQVQKEIRIAKSSFSQTKLKKVKMIQRGYGNI